MKVEDLLSVMDETLKQRLHVVVKQPDKAFIFSCRATNINNGCNFRNREVYKLTQENIFCWEEKEE